MAILNVTPDSFSDGGKYLRPDTAIRRACQLVAEGADIVDMGAESTRPGSKAVSPKEQLRRLLPVLRGFRRRNNRTPVSVDTQSALVAEACLAEGANMINDVSALRFDRNLAAIIAKAGCAVLLMHMRGRPRTMQKKPRYTDVVGDIAAFFKERLAFCAGAGINPSQILIDPGIGFGKTLEHNLEILRRLDEFSALKLPVVIGVSRKRFLGSLTGEPKPERRVSPSVAAGLIAAAKGAAALRVHDVAEHREALNVASAIFDSKFTIRD